MIGGLEGSEYGFVTRVRYVSFGLLSGVFLEKATADLWGGLAMGLFVSFIVLYR